MKILFFNEYTSVYGGTDTVVDTELYYLKKVMIDVKCCSFFNQQFLDSHLIKKLSIYSSSCIEKSISTKLQNEINNYQPDIIHFHNIYQIFRSPIWLKINPGRAKIILHLHNFYPFCLNSLMYRKGYCRLCFDKDSWFPGIMNRCYSNSFLKSFLVAINRINPIEWILNVDRIMRIFVVSRFLYNQLVGLGVPAGIMEILPNPVKLQVINRKGNYVLFLGNIAYEKGVSTFCETAQKLPWINFIAAGEGEALKFIKKKYGKLNNLNFAGYINGSDKEDLLLNCRFLYLPVHCFETFGLVILEAFSHGKPVLTTGKGATGELVKNGITGIINDDPDISSQAASVMNLWNETSEDHKYSTNCFELSKEYTIKRHISTLLKTYSNIL